MKKEEIIIKKVTKVLMAITSFLLLNLSIIGNQANATFIQSAELSSGGDCGSLLTYKGVPRICKFAQYTDNGKVYPVYCLDKTKHGVGDTPSYKVIIQGKVTDVKLWRIVTNGYPYRTPAELGCANKEEAFQATKQAIYCYIHNNNPKDYGAIGVAGQRALNALNKILNDANKSTEVPVSNIVNIVKESDKFDIDNIQKDYVSKVYSVKAKADILDYVPEILTTTDLPEEIKIVSVDNKEKQKFTNSEKFKILIPIKNLTKDFDFKIQVKTQIKSKPVLYGKSEDPSFQDVAVVTSIYEDAQGLAQDKVFKNETKIKIIKQDKETKARLENVEFNILDKDKKVIFANLKTNKNGEINLENFIPGKYFIQETNPLDGYLSNNELLEFNVNLNEKLTVTIDNLFEKKPDIVPTIRNINQTVDNNPEDEPIKETSENNIKETLDNNLEKEPVKEETENNIEKTLNNIPEEEPTKKVSENNISKTIVRKLPVTGM